MTRTGTNSKPAYIIYVVLIIVDILLSICRQLDTCTVSAKFSIYNIAI